MDMFIKPCILMCLLACSQEDPFVRLDVGTGLLGAPMLTLDLAIDTVHRAIDGKAHLTQATNPPLDLRMNVSGSYFTFYVRAAATNAVALTGYPDLDWPPWGGPGPVLPEILNVSMRLDSDFQDGVASYRYRVWDEEQWTEVNDVPVRKE